MNWYRSIQIDSLSSDLDAESPMERLEGLSSDLRKVAAEVGLMESPEVGSAEHEDWVEKVNGFMSMVSPNAGGNEKTPRYWGVKAALENQTEHNLPEE